jgi:hypothetical protein
MAPSSPRDFEDGQGLAMNSYQFVVLLSPTTFKPYSESVSFSSYFCSDYICTFLRYLSFVTAARSQFKLWQMFPTMGLSAACLLRCLLTIESLTPELV